MADFGWGNADEEDDPRMISQSCVRNRDPILGVICDVFPDEGLALEIGSGTGQHVTYFAGHLPDLTWQPADLGSTFDSIRAWIDHRDVDNVRPPVQYDLFDEEPPVEAADAILCVNTIHIAPWEATQELFELGRDVLAPGAPLLLYGPFRYEDEPLEPSNQRFEEWLKRRDPQSGIRTFEEIDAIAADLGFIFGGDRAMPANNHCIWWLVEPTTVT